MKSFEDRLSRLEEISREINQDCPLEKALKLFEEGLGLSQNLETELSKIERKVEILLSAPEISPEENGEETPPAAGRKKTSGKDGPILDLFPDIDED